MSPSGLRARPLVRGGAAVRGGGLRPYRYPPCRVVIKGDVVLTGRAALSNCPVGVAPRRAVRTKARAWSPQRLDRATPGSPYPSGSLDRQCVDSRSHRSRRAGDRDHRVTWPRWACLPSCHRGHRGARSRDPTYPMWEQWPERIWRTAGSGWSRFARRVMRSGRNKTANRTPGRSSRSSTPTWTKCCGRPRTPRWPRSRHTRMGLQQPRTRADPRRDHHRAGRW